MELNSTAELVLFETTQVRKVPGSISQAENAGSIPVTRSTLMSLSAQKRQHPLGKPMRFVVEWVAGEHKAVDTNRGVAQKCRCHLIRVADDRSADATAGDTDASP